MSDVVDLKAEREKRDPNRPDDALVVDIDGVKWYAFSASYLDGEKEFSISFWALDQEDAERRLLLMNCLALDGQILSRIDND